MSLTKIPNIVLNEMKNQGAIIEKLKGENLSSVSNIIYGDAAWKVYETWGNTIDSNIKVGAIFAPPENIIHSISCPDYKIGVIIQREVNSIIYYHAQSRIEDIVDLGSPLIAPRVNVKIQHAPVALSKLIQRIQNPTANYPTINSLPPGSYICTIDYQLSNVGLDIELFKSE